MGIKVYYSSTSGSMEIKSHQSFVDQVLNVKNIAYEKIDITNPDMKEEKGYMLANAKARKANGLPLPPQIFNDDQYCGDYEDLSEANETETLEEFLKLSSEVTSKMGSSANGHGCGYLSVQSNGQSDGYANGHGFTAASDNSNTVM